MSLSIVEATITLTDAQIKALPTTPVAYIPAPGVGFWISILRMTLVSTFTSAYTNINATWCEFKLDNANGYGGYVLSLADDSSMATDLTQFTAIFGTAGNRMAVLNGPWIAALNSGAASGDTEYVVPYSIIDPSGVNNDAVRIAIDNNGSGNLTGGHASNTLKVTTYYIKEAL